MDSKYYPFKINGYIYSPKTRKAFLRMQRQGIPRPIFSAQDRLAKLLAAKYKAEVREALKELRAATKANGLTLDAPEDDSVEALLKYFKELQEKARKETQTAADRANLANVARQLKEKWGIGSEEAEIDEDLREDIDKAMKGEQADFLKRLFIDAGGKTHEVLARFEIDKKKFFEDNMSEVRRLYVDNALKRIAGEKNLIKSGILERITDYAEGRSDDLTLTDLTDYAYKKGDGLSRLFARDQMQRFNKACALATFRAAKVTKVKWATANDGRVRSKGHLDKNGVWHRPHTELQGKIFPIDQLPIEIDDYNCRCGLVPVEWEDD